MKVTVAFGEVKVVVPCGSGEISVGGLADLAVTRYKKSMKQDRKFSIMSVVINSLVLARDNGILDWDDRVSDVIDDRELIIANYQCRPSDTLNQSQDMNHIDNSVTLQNEIESRGCNELKSHICNTEENKINSNMCNKNKENTSNINSTMPVQVRNELAANEGTTASKANNNDDYDVNNDDNLRNGEIIAEFSDKSKSNDEIVTEDHDINNIWPAAPSPIMNNLLTADATSDSTNCPTYSTIVKKPIKSTVNNCLEMKSSQENKSTEMSINNANANLSDIAEEDNSQQSSVTAINLSGVHQSFVIPPPPKLLPPPMPPLRSAFTKLTTNPISIPSKFPTTNQPNSKIIVNEKSSAAATINDSKFPLPNFTTESSSKSEQSIPSLFESEEGQNEWSASNGGGQSADVESITTTTTTNNSHNNLPGTSNLHQSANVTYYNPLYSNSITNTIATNNNTAAVTTTNKNNTQLEVINNPIMTNPMTSTIKVMTATCSANPNTITPCTRTSPFFTVSLKKSPTGFGFSLTSRQNPVDLTNPVYVSKVLDNGPAIVDGRLKAGDRIIMINDENVSYFTQKQVKEKLLNVPVDSYVKIGLNRPNNNDSISTMLLKNKPSSSKISPNMSHTVDNSTNPNNLNTQQDNLLNNSSPLNNTIPLNKLSLINKRDSNPISVEENKPVSFSPCCCTNKHSLPCSRLNLYHFLIGLRQSNEYLISSTTENRPQNIGRNEPPAIQLHHQNQLSPTSSQANTAPSVSSVAPPPTVKQVNTRSAPNQATLGISVRRGISQMSYNNLESHQHYHQFHHAIQQMNTPSSTNNNSAVQSQVPSSNQNISSSQQPTTSSNINPLPDANSNKNKVPNSNDSEYLNNSRLLSKLHSTCPDANYQSTHRFCPNCHGILIVKNGVFIKSVIPGGAAFSDNRVIPGDEILAVQGVCLYNCEEFHPPNNRVLLGDSYDPRKYAQFHNHFTNILNQQLLNRNINSSNNHGYGASASSSATSSQQYSSNYRSYDPLDLLKQILNYAQTNSTSVSLIILRRSLDQRSCSVNTVASIDGNTTVRSVTVEADVHTPQQRSQHHDDLLNLDLIPSILPMSTPLTNYDIIGNLDHDMDKFNNRERAERFDDLHNKPHHQRFYRSHRDDPEAEYLAGHRRPSDTDISEALIGARDGELLTDTNSIDSRENDLICLQSDFGEEHNNPDEDDVADVSNSFHRHDNEEENYYQYIEERDDHYSDGDRDRDEEHDLHSQAADDSNHMSSGFITDYDTVTPVPKISNPHKSVIPNRDSNLAIKSPSLISLTVENNECSCCLVDHLHPCTKHCCHHNFSQLNCFDYNSNFNTPYNSTTFVDFSDPSSNYLLASSEQSKLEQQSYFTRENIYRQSFSGKRLALNNPQMKTQNSDLKRHPRLLSLNNKCRLKRPQSEYSLYRVPEEEESVENMTMSNDECYEAVQTIDRKTTLKRRQVIRRYSRDRPILQYSNVHTNS